MRHAVYWLFALVAWPALVWGAFELAFRLATASFEGIDQTALLTAAAAATILISRKRQAVLVPTRD